MQMNQDSTSAEGESPGRVPLGSMQARGPPGAFLDPMVGKFYVALFCCAHRNRGLSQGRVHLRFPDSTCDPLRLPGVLSGKAGLISG